LKLFPGKLCLRWLGPFKVKKVYSYGVIDIGMEAGSQLKHYYMSEPIDGKVFYNLPDATSSYHPFMIKLIALKECFFGVTLDSLLSI